jgi:methyl-accepting chemotaxis protein
MVGYELDELIGKNHSMFVPYSERRDPSYVEFWKSLRGGQNHSEEFRRITKQKGDIWIRGSYNPIKDKTGQVLKIIKFAFDISKEKAVNLSNSQWIKAIHKSNAVVECDLDGTILSANKNFLDIFGYTASRSRSREGIKLVCNPLE